MGEEGRRDRWERKGRENRSEEEKRIRYNNSNVRYNSIIIYNIIIYNSIIYNII